MQIRDNDTELIYGLLKSICEWALEKGYTDISAMKNLTKLAMIDVCMDKHKDKPPTVAQIASVMDLGLSLRTVQRGLNEIDDLNDVSDRLIRIPQVLRIVLAKLTAGPKTLEDIHREVSYLIHAPESLQLKAIKSILNGLISSNIVTKIETSRTVKYELLENQISLVNLRDKSAKMLGMAAFMEAYFNIDSEPCIVSFNSTPTEAKRIQKLINMRLIKIGTELEKTSEQCEDRKPFYYGFGSASHLNTNEDSHLSKLILEVLWLRSIDPKSPSMARTHWYYLSPQNAELVYSQVIEFIDEKVSSAVQASSEEQTKPFFIVFSKAAHGFTAIPN
ncbi:hypothetical protein CEE37_07675 [candidate division LCP-89 bacterium B3_LCP]|uniref:Uncharacterized protein n=1 Tax=candidate division LCP-89 bacterium B3_LCP TaxID=2012998 RepID=A0A532V132_UNCL8|nr:MAG: hypothetical protein CEE37_07675 [candidate division LCP-89 bacterium B3_LCP]